MEALLIGLRIMALLTLARWLTRSTATLSSWAKGLGALTLAYAPIHALVFWLLQEPGGVVGGGETLDDDTELVQHPESGLLEMQY